MWDDLWVGGTIATMRVPSREPPPGMAAARFGAVPDGAVAAFDGRIAWVGPRQALPGAPADLARQVHDLAGRVVTPGLVDSHTHVVHSGSSLIDFELLCRRATREEIKAAGGGVRRNVAAVRALPLEALYEESATRVRRLIAGGVTTLESKSGYGLDCETELKQLRVTRLLGARLPIDTVATFLGAHALAPEYEGRRDDYTAFLADEVLPAARAEGLVDMVDGFCDYDGFSHAQMSRLFDKARALGLPTTLHADQYTDFAAGALAAAYGALSAAHLEFASEATIAAMARSGTVATLLPGANWTLASPRTPPLDLFRKHGVPLALATNNNPTSSYTTMPTLIMHMGCRLFGMTPEEAVAAFTRVGAKALGLDGDRGTIEVGKRADLVVWDVGEPAALPYPLGENPCLAVVKDGRTVYRARRPDIAGR